MVRGFTVLMMVLLIGNPFCCCAFAHASSAADSALPACCRGKLDAGATGADAAVPGQNREAPLNCPCLKEPGVVAASELLVPAAQISTPAPSFHFHGMAMLPAAKEMSRGHLLHPGRYGPDATAPPLRLLYGVFRC